MLRLYQPQNIRRTGVSDGNALAALQFNCNIVRRISFLWGEKFQLWFHDFFFRCKDCIVKSGNMCGTGSHIRYTAFGEAYHTSSCHTKYTNIQGSNVCPVSANDRVIDGRAAILNHTDIGRRSTNLKVHTIGGSQVHERSHNRCCRSGKHGQYRTFLHLVDLHNTTITTHDHQWHFHACRTDTCLGRIRCVKHLREDAGIDRRRSCPSRESIELGDIRRHAGLHSHFFFRHFVNRFLTAHIIYAERLGRYDNFRAFSLHIFRRFFDGIMV